MQFIKFSHTVLLAVLFIATTNVYAIHSGSPIKCPSLAKIHQAANAINRAELSQHNDKHRYNAMSDKTVLQESGLYWVIAATNVVASSSNEAITNAQKLASSVTFMLDENAMQIVLPTCFYFVSEPSNPNNMKDAAYVIALGLNKPYPVHASLISSIHFKNSLKRN